MLMGRFWKAPTPHLVWTCTLLLLPLVSIWTLISATQPRPGTSAIFHLWISHRIQVWFLKRLCGNITTNGNVWFLGSRSNHPVCAPSGNDWLTENPPMSMICSLGFQNLPSVADHCQQVTATTLRHPKKIVSLHFTILWSLQENVTSWHARKRRGKMTVRMPRPRGAAR